MAEGSSVPEQVESGLLRTVQYELEELMKKKPEKEFN
jgi:hypothetical protein